MTETPEDSGTTAARCALRKDGRPTTEADRSKLSCVLSEIAAAGDCRDILEEPFVYEIIRESRPNSEEGLFIVLKQYWFDELDDEAIADTERQSFEQDAPLGGQVLSRIESVISEEYCFRLVHGEW